MKTTIQLNPTNCYINLTKFMKFLYNCTKKLLNTKNYQIFTYKWMKQTQNVSLYLNNRTLY